MARITRSSILQWVQDALGIQNGADSVPQYLTNQVVPVFDIQPKITNFVTQTTSTATGDTTIFTTPTDKDFFITFATIANTANAASDSVVCSIGVTIGGATRRIMYLVKETTTAGSQNAEMCFTYPIKVDRGSIIRLTKAFTAGATTVNATIGGYTLE
jgi:hypothetical protein